MSGCDYVEPCHTGDCDGPQEVLRLLPKGRIWQPRDGTYGRVISAIGHANGAIKKRICQELSEHDPCRARRRLPEFAALYRFPSCVDLSAENLCAWLALISDRSCPIGSIGFLRRAVAFAAPGKAITLTFNKLEQPGWRASAGCAAENPIVISAPPECFAFCEMPMDYPLDPQDGVNQCRSYFIPEIECIRDKIFPLGVGVGYLTDPQGPDGQEIWGVTGDPVACLERSIINCNHC